VLHTAAMS